MCTSHDGSRQARVLLTSGPERLRQHPAAAFAARADLPDLGTPTHRTHELAGYLILVVRQQQPMTELVIIGYGDAGHVDPAVRTLAEALSAAGLPVRALLRVIALTTRSHGTVSKNF